MHLREVFELWFVWSFLPNHPLWPSITCIIRFRADFARHNILPLTIGVILSSWRVRQLWVLSTSIHIFVEHWMVTGTTIQSQCLCKICNLSLEKPIYERHTLYQTCYRISIRELTTYLHQNCRSTFFDKKWDYLGGSHSFASVTRSLIFNCFYMPYYFWISTLKEIHNGINNLQRLCLVRKWGNNYMYVWKS